VFLLLVSEAIYSFTVSRLPVLALQVLGHLLLAAAAVDSINLYWAVVFSN
jgi:hypothetical protein